VGPALHVLSATSQPTGPVISTGLGRPTPHPPTMPVISIAVSRPTPHSPNRACHFDRSGPTLFPTFAPAKVSAHAVEKSLFDQRRQPLFLQIGYYSVTKMPQTRPIQHPQPAQFQHLPNSCFIRAIPVINDLRTLFERSWSLFAPPILCFQPLVDSFAQNTGGRGMALKKTEGRCRVKSMGDRWQRR
jgi:hypothetical protein